MKTMSSQQIRPAHAKNSLKLQLILGALILLILALGFNALLSLNTLEKLYVESIASQYSAIGVDLQQTLERAVKLGKKIEKFVGMDKILADSKHNLTRKQIGGTTDSVSADADAKSEVSVSIALPDGSILYSTDEQLVGTVLPKELKIFFADVDDATTAARKTSYVKYKARYLTTIPIRSADKQWIATAIITFDESRVRSLLMTVRNQNIKLIMMILTGSMILLLILLPLATPKEAAGQITSKRGVTFVMFLVVGLAQILFASLNTYTFRNYYVMINKQKAEMFTTLLKEDIEFFFSKGLRIDKLVKIDVMMGEIIAASPELNDIAIYDKDGLPLYLANKTGVIDFQKEIENFKEAYLQVPIAISGYHLRFDLLKETTPEGYVITNLSKEVIFARLLDIGLDSATVVVISLLFFGEMLILILLYVGRPLEVREKPTTVHYELIRPAGFLMLFGLHSSISFLPLYMASLYKPLWNLSKDMVLGLPISSEMLFTGLAMIIAGVWMDRRGWHEPFLSGLLLASGGLLYCWLAPDAFHFILARGVAGLGYGFALMASQGFVINNTDESQKALGLARLFAGIYAGSICGSAAGGMLAERIGYRAVFLFGAIFIVGVILYTLLSMRSAMHKPKSHSAEEPGQSVTTIQFFRFFFSRNVLCLNLLSALPSALVLVGFLNYFSPIYLNQVGASQSNIGRMFMIYNVSLVYFAPFISQYITFRNSKRYVFLSGMLGGAAFLLFYYFGGLPVTAVAVFLLGISSSLAGSQRSYILGLDATKQLGAGKAMSIFNLLYRLGQVFGPLTFGWLLLVTGINKGITYVGLVYLIMTMFFMLFAQQTVKPATVKS